MAGVRAKALNNGSPAMGHGFASARRGPMDLQEIHSGQC